MFVESWDAEFLAVPVSRETMTRLCALAEASFVRPEMMLSCLAGTMIEGHKARHPSVLILFDELQRHLRDGVREMGQVEPEWPFEVRVIDGMEEHVD